MQIFENSTRSLEQKSAAEHCLAALDVLEATYALEIQKQELLIASLQKPVGDRRPANETDFTFRRAA